MDRRALLLLAAAATLFGVMAFSAKLASGRIGGSQIAFVRFAIGALPALLVPSYRRRALQVQRLDLLLYRGVFGGVAVLLYFLAIENVAVGTATLLNYTSPVFSVAFATLFLGEAVAPRIVVPFLTTLAGVGLVVTAGAGGPGLARPGPWEVVAVGSAICSGAAVTAIRAARRTETSWAVFASFTLFGLLVSAPLGLGRWVTPGRREWLWLAVVGVTALAAQLLMTHAFRWVDNLRAGVVAQLAVVVAMGLGVLLLDEPLGGQRLLGSFLALGGVVTVVALGGPAVSAPGGASPEIVATERPET